MNKLINNKIHECDLLGGVQYMCMKLDMRCIMLSFLLLSLLIGGSIGVLNIDVNQSDGSFKILIDGDLWFNSGPIWVQNMGQTLSTADATLVLQAHYQFSPTGSDTMGHFATHVFNWTSHDKGFKFQTYINIYADSPIIVFGQNFIDGLSNASTEGKLINSTISSFPTIQIEEGSVDLGYLTFYSGQISATSVNRWLPDAELYDDDDGGYPLVVFDSDMSNTIVVSPLNTFMASSVTYTSPSVGFGIISSVDNVPPGYIYETILVADQTVTSTMSYWGGLLLEKYGKDTSYRETDFSLNYLGYWTDNGACYYHYTGTAVISNNNIF